MKITIDQVRAAIEAGREAARKTEGYLPANATIYLPGDDGYDKPYDPGTVLHAAFCRGLSRAGRDDCGGDGGAGQALRPNADDGAN